MVLLKITQNYNNYGYGNYGYGNYVGNAPR